MFCLSRVESIGSSPYSPQRQLCNGGYRRPWQEENQGNPATPAKLSLFDKLLLSHQVWLQLGVDPEQVKEILRCQPAGAFLVWSNNGGKHKILTVRLDHQTCETEDFIVKENGSVYYLEHSYLGFTSIFQLIGYYCVSRDVLPSRLLLPFAILCSTDKEELERISVLGMQFWDQPMNQQQGSCNRDSPGGSAVIEAAPTTQLLKQQQLPMCSIQVTGENGALFFINPLFLKEHGDGWLGQGSPCSLRRSRVATKCRKRSAGSARNPDSPHKQPEILERNDSEKSDSGRSVDEDEMFKVPHPEPNPELLSTVLRRKIFTQRAAWSWGEDLESDSGERREETAGSLCPGERGPAMARESSTLPPNYRASWAETGALRGSSTLRKAHSETSLLACDSPTLPPISELDSLSISSVEEESVGALILPPRHRHKRHSHALTDKVKNRLSAVSHAFGGLVSPDRRVRNRIEELGHNKDCYFGSLVQGFVSYTAQSGNKHASSTEMLQGVQQMITSLRNYLTQSSELTHILDQSDQEDCDTEMSIQKALHKCVLKPLKDHIYSCLADFHSKDGSLRKLTDNQLVLQTQSLAQLGVMASVPDAPALEKIQQRLSAMHLAYSPFKKVAQLLKACKLIYEAMSATSGKPYGADDFLPVLTYVLATSNLTNLSLDVEYMMEILDQSQLQGEGGYYLTTMFGALFHISTFQPKLLSRQMSDEAKSSLCQWRRRRTLHHNQSRRRSAQDLLKVYLHERGGNQVTVLAPSHVTVVEVCKACAERFEVPDPESYGLFVERGGVYQPLELDACPQLVKQEAQQDQPGFSFVYRVTGGGEPQPSPPEEEVTPL
ncbi:ras and Rab interactor 3-like isoform X2 [Amblyraja radiata]|uniref:ras and Rab interactor 3-like isoform X2 n=1 Tax=Amblyraja radiata TaxID=386614 RepID=UPI001402BC92|nr:ras and Rab interactor 3-like isoform X2 [Amblyraja radiata]